MKIRFLDCSEIISHHYGAVAVILEKICCVLNQFLLKMQVHKYKNVFRKYLTPLWNCCCHSRENLLCSESTCAKNMRRDATAIIRNPQWSKSANSNKDTRPWFLVTSRKKIAFLVIFSSYDHKERTMVEKLQFLYRSSSVLKYETRRYRHHQERTMVEKCQFYKKKHVVPWDQIRTVWSFCTSKIILD